MCGTGRFSISMSSLPEDGLSGNLVNGFAFVLKQEAHLSQMDRVTCTMSVEILSTAAQLYETSHLKRLAYTYVGE